MTKTIESNLNSTYWSKCYLPAYISGAMLFISGSFVCSVFRAICLWIQILGVLRVLCHPSRSILDGWNSTQSTPRLWNFSSVKYLNLIKSCSTNQVGYTQLNRHRSFTCQWILGVLHLQCSRSVQIWRALHSHTIIPWCALHAATSITVDSLPFNIITYSYIHCPHIVFLLYSNWMFLKFYLFHLPVCSKIQFSILFKLHISVSTVHIHYICMCGRYLHWKAIL